MESLIKCVEHPSFEGSEGNSGGAAESIEGEQLQVGREENVATEMVKLFQKERTNHFLREFANLITEIWKNSL